MNTSSLRQAGATVLLVSVAVKAVGYVREAVVAAVFGTTAVIDLYLAAVALPAAICTAVYYSLPNAFIPLFAGDRATDRRAHRVAWGVAGLMLALSAAVWLLAEPISGVLARGFSPDVRAESASLLRIGAWAIVLAAAEALGRAHLLAGHSFVRPGLAFLWQSAALIAAAVIWSRHGPQALMWGYVIGTGLAAAWNFIPRIRKDDRDVAPTQPENTGATGPVASWIATVIAVDAIAQLFGLIDRHLGSYLPVGSIAALQYGSQIAFIPFSILGMGLSTAIFPFLSSAVAEGNRTEVGSIIDRAVHWMLLGAVPLVVWMVAFRAEIVTLLLERGAFDAGSRQVTAIVLAALGLGLIPTVLTLLWSRVFYSSRQWQPLFYGSVVGVVTKAVCGWWGAGHYGVAGLAAATSVAYCVWLVPILWALRVYVSRRQVSAWLACAARVFLLAVVPAAIVLGVARMILPDGALSTPAAAIVRLGAGSALGGLTILVLGPRFGIAESATVRSWMAGMFRCVWGDR